MLYLETEPRDWSALDVQPSATAGGKVEVRRCSAHLTTGRQACSAVLLAVEQDGAYSL